MNTPTYRIAFLIVTLLVTDIAAQENRDSAPGVSAGYLELEGAPLGEVTAHDVMMISSTVPASVELLRRSGRTIPEQVDALLAAAHAANTSRDRYRAYRLFARAAGWARGKDLVESYEVAASFGASLNRALFTDGETITLTLKPRFTLGHSLANRYTMEAWLETPSGIIQNSEKILTVSDLEECRFDYPVQGLSDGIVAVGYRLKSPTSMTLAELNYAVVVAKGVQSRHQRLNEKFAALKTKGASASSPAFASALETIDYLLRNFEPERSKYDGHWARTAHPFGMSQRRLTAVALGLAVDDRGGKADPHLEVPLFNGRIRYPEDFVLAEALADTIGASPDTLRNRSGDMGLAYRSTTDGTLLHYRLYVPRGEKAPGTRALIIALHSGAGDASYLDYPDLKAVGVKPLQQLAEENGFIIATPNGERGFTDSRGEKDLLDLMDRLQALYSIEAKRTYLMGWSLGGATAWRIAMKYPARFGAMASVTGAAGWLNRENTRTATALPVFHCEPEQAQSSERAQRTKTQATELLRHFTFKSYPETDHISVWPKALPDVVAFFAACAASDAANSGIAPAAVSFADNGQKLGTGESWHVQLVDINGDGRLEAYFDGAIWLNDRQGHFSKSEQSFGPVNRPAYFADLNGDGFVDVVCDNVVQLNDGKFQFSRKKPVHTDIPMVAACLADLNGDGVIDLIVAGRYEDRILLNDGKGNFRDTRTGLGGWAQCTYAVGDINGDGLADIYVAIPHTPPPAMKPAKDKIWLGDRHGSFTEATHVIPVGEHRGVILADLNGDKSLDLLVNGAGGSQVFFNDGKANFSDSGQRFGSGGSIAGDFNGDGSLDVFLYDGKPTDNGKSNTVWLNDGKGRFTDSGLRLGNANSVAAAVGDLNGDGKLDVFVANVKNVVTKEGAGLNEVWLNTTDRFAANISRPPEFENTK
jgi:dienelactone hydrolase